MARYVHTNLIARDAKRLTAFYKEALGLKSIGETRDLSGEWLDRLTGVVGAHIVGEHLLLPGYGDDHPTLEIFSYEPSGAVPDRKINAPGFAHIAFEVDEVEESLKKVLALGGGMLGELVHADYPDGRRATFVYATDIEGNIIELQSWK